MMIDHEFIHDQAKILVQEQQARDISDMRFEDISKESDIRFLYEDEFVDRWTGTFKDDNNDEKIYEVTYRYEADQFYVSVYTLKTCVPVDAPDMSCGAHCTVHV